MLEVIAFIVFMLFVAPAMVFVVGNRARHARLDYDVHQSEAARRIRDAEGR